MKSKENNINFLLDYAGKKSNKSGEIGIVWVDSSDINSGSYDTHVKCTLKDGVWTDELGWSRKESEIDKSENSMLHQRSTVVNGETISWWRRFVDCTCEDGIWTDTIGNTWVDDGILIDFGD